MDKTTLERKQSALKTILSMSDINVPVKRKNVTEVANIRWLQRNFLINNSEHPLARTVMDLLKQLVTHV